MVVNVCDDGGVDQRLTGAGKVAKRVVGVGRGREREKERVFLLFLFIIIVINFFYYFKC